MAASGYTPIQIYYSPTTGHVPSASNLVAGELAINTRDGILYYKNTNTNAVSVLATASSGAATVLGGTTGALLYQTAASTTGFLSLGTSSYLLTAGATAPQYTNPTSVTVGYATNVVGGATGSIPYQTAASTTTLLAAGTNGQVLTISGGVPTWATSGTATLANNLANGAAGQILYQIAADDTGFSAAGTVGQVFLSGGTTAPTWSNQSALSVGTATTATNLASGTSGALPYQNSAGNTTFLSLGSTNTVLTAGVAGPQYVAQSTLSVGAATTATNITGGTTGALPYQSGVNATTFLSAGANGQVLTLAGGVPTWATAGAATTATNLAGGASGAVPYQSASGTTGFVGAGTAGQLFVSAGTSAPVWTNGSSVSVGSATNLVGGSNGSVPYQTGSGATTFLAPGTNGYVLTLAGGVPTWAAGSTVSLSSANTWTGTQTFNGTSSTFATKIVNTAEPMFINTSAVPVSINVYVNTASVYYYTGFVSGAETFNFSFSSGTTLNTAMAVNDSVTCVVMLAPTTTTGYPTTFTIDGTSITPKWLGGFAPTQSNSGNIDAYTFTIIKTASSTFTLLAAQSTYG
jgi:hypothetical protein